MGYKVSFTEAAFELGLGEKVCLACRFSRPVFSGPGAWRLNLYCSRFYSALKGFCRKRLLPRLAGAPERGPVAVRTDCAITNNDEACLSFCLDVSLGKGPPRRYASNWDPKTGFPLSSRLITGAGRRVLAARVAALIEGRSGPGRNAYYKDYKKQIKRRLSTDNLFVRDAEPMFFSSRLAGPALEDCSFSP